MVEVNVSLEKLNEFSECIATFKRQIESECNELKTAFSSLIKSMDAETLSTILKVVLDISDLLNESDLALSTLASRVDFYAEFIERLKNASKTDTTKDQPNKSPQKNFMADATIAAFMKASLKANDFGYKTTDGYVLGVGVDAAMKIAGNFAHIPSDVQTTQSEAVRSMAHLYDENQAVNNPQNTMNFAPSDIPQELIEKNTRVISNASSNESSISPTPYPRTIVGTPGIVTGGDSIKLGKNMLSEMNVSRGLKWGSSGYQAHHIIPKEFSSHPVIQKIGMDMDHASNGIFLKTPNDGINTKSVHFGYHEEYSEAILDYLDSLDTSENVVDLEKKVAALQKSLKISLENGVPLYMKKGNSITGPITYKHKGGGATKAMWSAAIKKNIK